MAVILAVTAGNGNSGAIHHPGYHDEMIHHIKAVVRARRMPWLSAIACMSYISSEHAISNAARFIQEGGAQAYKWTAE
jgi:ketopantoate hydroxymethyltransferase